MSARAMSLVVKLKIISSRMGKRLGRFIFEYRSEFGGVISLAVYTVPLEMESTPPK